MGIENYSVSVISNILQLLFEVYRPVFILSKQLKNTRKYIKFKDLASWTTNEVFFLIRFKL
jgi:hypothetical protein